MDLTMTYGVMPTREQFDAQCVKADPDTGRSVADDGFGFGRDPRVGSTRMSQEELWEECQRAFAEYQEGSEKAGEWLSSVLGCLGIEWV